MNNIRNNSLPKAGGRALLLLSFFALMAAHACQVPVFRYALERWEPAPYLLRITPGAGGLTADERTLLESLQNPAEPANLEIEIAPPADKPALTLHYPHTPRDAARQPIWQTDLTKENALGVIDSPVRRELTKRLLSGQTAIWVLLASGDSAKDEEAVRTLEESMKVAQEKVKLPGGVITQEEAGKSSGPKLHENADVLQSDLPLRIEFSLLRLSRTSQEEAAFINMLTHLEPDLDSYAKEPMAFPVFGRGRALEPLIGKGIHPDNIMETSSYLCGACSCEIKDQNPGIDLLLAANWDPVDNAPKIETVRIEPAAPASVTATASEAGGRIWKSIVLLLALILAAGFLFRKVTAPPTRDP